MVVGKGLEGRCPGSVRGDHVLLLVDDEASITRALHRVFRKEGYHILTAQSGEEGLKVLDQAERPVSLIISDQRMPGMSGAQFLEKAKEIFPDAIRFLLTGYSDMDAIVDAVNKGEIHRYLTKPWNDHDLVLQVRQALEQYDLVVENRRLLLLTHEQNQQLSKLNRDLERRVEERSEQILEKNKELSRLNQELESNFYNTVRAFASLAEMHAPKLAGHGRRVSLLSREMAKFLKLDEGETLDIEIAALLHDIGKVGFSKKLLDYREQKWTAQDRTLFQMHPEEGQTIVRFIGQLDRVGALIRSHHERYDGQGYPDQLEKNAIPRGSRLIAITNAYDKALKIEGVIKSCLRQFLEEKKISPEGLSTKELLQHAALYHLEKNANSLYDPYLVSSFIDLLKSNGMHYKREKAVPVAELKEGMVLARSLYTSKGRFLLPHDAVLTRDYIDKLLTIHQNDPIADSIHVIAD